MEKHKTVLLEEAIDYLNIKEDGNYIDATLGYAGHSSKILEKLTKGTLLCFDKDKEAIDYSRSKLLKLKNNFKIFNTGFINIKEVILKENIKIDGVLFDLGVSSPMLDDEKRGFSYMKDARLDMRMNKEASLTAYQIVNTYSISKLTDIFRKYGEEKHALKIAKTIDSSRKQKPVETTLELVAIIDKCYPYKEKRNTHPAKKVFQALRIEVNNELGEFSKALNDALDILNVGGRVVVITFHSLEDRICKNIFKERCEINDVVKGLPEVPLEMLPDFKLITPKAIIPTIEEQKLNPRSKSAKMRVIEKIK